MLNKKKYLNVEVQEYFKENYLVRSGDTISIIIDINDEPYKDSCSSLEKIILNCVDNYPKAVVCVVNGVATNRKSMILRKELIHIDNLVYEIIIGTLPSGMIYSDAKFLRSSINGSIERTFNFNTDITEVVISNIKEISLEIK